MAQNLEELTVKLNLDIDDDQYQRAKKNIENLQTSKAGFFKKASDGMQREAGLGQNLALKTGNLLEAQRLTAILEQLKSINAITAKILKEKELERETKGYDDKDDEKKGKKPTDMLGQIFSRMGPLLAGFLAVKSTGLLAGLVNDFTQKVASTLERSMQLKSLEHQTGRSVAELYKLQVAAKIAGTSLDSIVGAAQGMARNIVSGGNETQLMILQGMGINPFEQIQGGGDFISNFEALYKRVQQFTKSLDPTIRAAVTELATGVSMSDQYGFSNLGRSSVQKGAQEVLEKRGDFGDIRGAYERFTIATEKIDASMDRIFSQKAATDAAVSVMQIKAQAVSIAADVLNVDGLKEAGSNILEGVGKGFDYIKEGVNTTVDWVSDKVGMSSEQAKIGGQ